MNSADGECGIRRNLGPRAAKVLRLRFGFLSADRGVRRIGVSEGKNPPASRFASVGPLWQRGQRRHSRAGDLFSTAEQGNEELFG
jgi:hypothetical protein